MMSASWLDRLNPSGQLMTGREVTPGFIEPLRGRDRRRGPGRIGVGTGDLHSHQSRSRYILALTVAGQRGGSG